LKITLATHHFPPHYVAGAEQYAFRVSRGLQQRGHTVEVVTIESITEGELEPKPEYEVYEGIPVWRLRFNLEKAPNRFEWLYRNPELGGWFSRYLEQSRPDVLHVNGGYLLGGKVFEAAFELRIPTVLILHEFWFMCPIATLFRPTGTICDHPVAAARCAWCWLSEKRRYRIPDIQLHGLVGDLFTAASQVPAFGEVTKTAGLVRQVEDRRTYLKSILERVDLVISPSQFLLDKVAEYGMHPRKAVHAAFGLDKLAYEDREWAAPGTSLRFGYLGQIVPHKGVHQLIQAFQQLKRSEGCRLLIYGKMDPESRYHRHLLKLARANPAIEFRGGYTYDQIQNVLSEVDTVVTPSVWYENRPTVIVEAFSAHRPVIAPRLGGMAELVEHDVTGLQYEPGSIRSLSAQMQRLVDQPELLQRLKNGIQPVMDLKTELDCLIKLYAQAIESSQAAP
jgi:glycosyltransferase involved in cell wall biosynthesis